MIAAGLWRRGRRWRRTPRRRRRRRPRRPAPAEAAPAPAAGAAARARSGRCRVGSTRSSSARKLLETSLAAAEAAATAAAIDHDLPDRRGWLRHHQRRSPVPDPVQGAAAGRRPPRLRRRARSQTSDDTFIIRRVAPDPRRDRPRADRLLSRARLRQQHDRPHRRLPRHAPVPLAAAARREVQGAGRARAAAGRPGRHLRRARARPRTCRRSARSGSSSGATSPAGSSATRPAYFNGNPDNGINDIDSNHAEDVRGAALPPAVQRPVAARPSGGWRSGVAASTGNEQGSATNTWLGAFKSFGQNTIFSYLTTTDRRRRCSRSGRHTRVNPQLYYYFGPFGLLAEWVHEHQQLANSAGSGAVNNSAGQRRGWRSSSAATRPTKGSSRTTVARSRERRLRRAGDRRPLQLARHRPRGLPDRGRSDQVGRPGARRSAWRSTGS